MRWVVPVAAAALAGLLAGVSPAGAASEIIDLKDGHQVVGEVVAEKPNALFIDLGFDIVKVPRDQVVGRRKGTDGGQGGLEPGGRGLRRRPHGVLQDGRPEGDPGQGPGPAVRRGGDLDRDPLGQGLGVHPQ